MQQAQILSFIALALTGSAVVLSGCGASSSASPADDAGAGGVGTQMGGSPGIGGNGVGTGGAGTAGSDMGTGMGGSDATGGAVGLGGSAGTPAGGLADCVGGPAPPETWQEHWFEHEQAVKRVYYDDCVAVYFDDDVNRTEAQWLFEYVSKIWKYSLSTYGKMGEERMFAIFHQAKYFGGHPSYWYSASHDNRNVADQGGNDWRAGNYDVASHEIGHIVESTAFWPKQGSPAFGLWRDSKWMEFYQYDLYLALGMEDHAQEVFNRFTNQIDDFPRPGTRWFRDWFYPLWRDYGHAQVMVKFYHLLRDHYTSSESGRLSDLNWGEYIHFTSGAAGKNLKSLATTAFGWPSEWETQFQNARRDFPDVTYND